MIKRKVLIIVSKIWKFKRVSGGGGANGCVHSSVAQGEGSDTCVSQYEERVLLVLSIQVML